jgi:hypothetical protein
VITWIEHTTPGHPVTGSGSSGLGGEIRAAASGLVKQRRRGRDVGGGWVRVTWGQVTGWLPKIGRGPGLRPETPSDLLTAGRDGRI